MAGFRVPPREHSRDGERLPLHASDQSLVQRRAPARLHHQLLERRHRVHGANRFMGRLLRGAGGRLQGIASDGHDEVRGLERDPARQGLRVGRLEARRRQRADGPLLLEGPRRARLEPSDGGNDRFGAALGGAADEDQPPFRRGGIERAGILDGENRRFVARDPGGADDSRLPRQRRDGANLGLERRGGEQRTDDQCSEHLLTCHLAAFARYRFDR